jgi:hypothetical protein
MTYNTFDDGNVIRMFLLLSILLDTFNLGGVEFDGSSGLKFSRRERRGPNKGGPNRSITAVPSKS